MSWSKYLNPFRLRESERDTTRDPRNEFESDFGRVIFSPAVRRMHDKTQVFPLTADDNIHSRLTHSMEVMAVGHSLGLRLCENEDFVKICGKERHILEREIPVLLKNACLVHDIGNPPFGHFGETVIKNFFKKYFSNENLGLSPEELEDFTLFDGNAQGFRVLTKLQILNDIYGLNLTFATLGAFLKYPNSGKVDENILSQSKRGVFQSEKDHLQKIATECDLIKGDRYKRHPLSFLMEAADSICYLVMDIEDGFNKGWYKFEYLEQKFKAIPSLETEFKKLNEKYTGNGAEITKMVKLRISLISKLVDIAVKNFLKNLDLICAGDYTQELIKDDEDGLAKALGAFCQTEIFPKRDITMLELTGHSVLSGLLQYYIDFVFVSGKHYKKRARGLISNSIILTAFLENGMNEGDDFENLSNYYKLRVIVDFISGMTDQFALNHYQKLSGQKII